MTSGMDTESVTAQTMRRVREEWTAPLIEALVLAERALRDQPMQAFRTEAARRRRAEALDAAQKALGGGAGDSEVTET